MSNLNLVQLIGRVGRDPELRKTPSGASVANASLATSERWKDKSSGENREATEWHRLVFYDRQAEVVAQYAPKGSLIYVSGQLKTRKWTDKDGVEKSTVEVQVRELKLLGGNQQQGGQQQRAATPAPAAKPQQQRQGGFDDDDIPF